MLYATVTDLVDRFGQRELAELTDQDNIPPSDIDQARMAVKIEDACAFIDGYVGQVYRLPLAGCAKPATVPGAAPKRVAPPVLTRLACDVARYYLYHDLAPENEVYRRYKAAVAELAAIASGAAQVACPWGGSPGEPLTGADAQTGSSGETWHSFSPRAVTDDTLRGFA